MMLKATITSVAAMSRRFAGILADMHRAQRRAVVLASAADRYAPHRDNAPDTYAEFMFRTSGPLLHEPPARRRATGKLVN
jgi:hypothetical protein